MSEFVSGLAIGAVLTVVGVLLFSLNPIFKHDVGYAQQACITRSGTPSFTSACASGAELDKWLKEKGR